MQVQVVERDFTEKGKMRSMPKEQSAKLKGFLPFYSVDTQEEVDAIIERAVASGEFHRKADGTLWEMTLAEAQTLENLNLAGDRLAEIHAALSPGSFVCGEPGDE